MIEKFNEFHNKKYEKHLNESIFNFMNSNGSESDIEEITKSHADIIDNYDLPVSDIENIQTKLSDAISKKLNIDSEEAKNYFK